MRANMGLKDIQRSACDTMKPLIVTLAAGFLSATVVFVLSEMELQFAHQMPSWGRRFWPNSGSWRTL